VIIGKSADKKISKLLGVNLQIGVYYKNILMFYEYRYTDIKIFEWGKFLWGDR